MTNQPISIHEFAVKSFSIWEDQWFLLTSGNFAEQNFNCMTISWGSIGVMWNKPFVQVVVRPTRHTFKFIQSFSDFTVCTFPEINRKALQLLGSRSGRDGDKIKAAGITPCRSIKVTAPAYLEANLVIECRTMYSDVLKPHNFLIPAIDDLYSKNDYHFIYYGEILSIIGDRELFT